MIVFFGLELDDLVHPQQTVPFGGIRYLGPQGLLQLLESYFGLQGHPNNNEFLRIEQYRQALRTHLEHFPDSFYQKSFTADQLATATALLDRRDELKLASWDFELTDSLPNRLKTLAEIEVLLTEQQTFAAGYADRFSDMLALLGQRKHEITEIHINEAFDLLPWHFQQLFQRMETLGVACHQLSRHEPKADSDLKRFQQRLTNKETPQGKSRLKNDGTLLLLKSKRETEAASFLAKLLQLNPSFRPSCLIPEKNRALDNAFIQEGLPSLGILSASLARPSLQILKLIPAFLWNPVDPFKIMEFVSLSVKPLADDLARAIAKELARTPGLGGEAWYVTIARYFAALEERAKSDANIDVAKIRFQYNFWFERTRYDVSQTVPRNEVIELFSYVKNWAFEAFDESGGRNASLLVLSEQAKRIVEMLEVIPDQENQLSNLALERIVRTIYEPSPVLFKEREIGYLPYVHYTSAFIGSVDQMVWWNFVHNERDHFFSKWYQQEIRYFDQLGLQLQHPKDENALLLWQRIRPILHCQKQLILILPEQVEGSKVHPHPLYGDLEAFFENLDDVIIDLSDPQEVAKLEQHFKVPQKIPLAQFQLGKPKPFLELTPAHPLDQREKESYTSLDALFYYPYQWVFKHKIQLHKSSILSLVKDNTLMGNLAHRFIELLLRQGSIEEWNKEKVTAWIDQCAYTLLPKEGAVLLMYGREPERVAFINKVKYAAWSLVAMIQNNGWSVYETEIDLKGKFMGIPVKGIADLVLQRGTELAIVDLKWSGAARRERIIRNEEDLQLVMYAKLLTEDDSWAHTAYFIIEQGKMIARNDKAFAEAVTVNPDGDHLEINERIWRKMERTFSWRMKQLEAGQIEIRTETTLTDLEDAFQGELMELLEMKTENSYFDDYKTLINLID